MFELNHSVADWPGSNLHDSLGCHVSEEPRDVIVLCSLGRPSDGHIIL